jgi:hypothetical protein
MIQDMGFVTNSLKSLSFLILYNCPGSSDSKNSRPDHGGVARRKVKEHRNLSASAPVSQIYERK